MTAWVADIQGLGMVGGVAVSVVSVRTVERRQVELVDHVQDEPGQVAGGGASRAGLGESRKGWWRSPRWKW